MMSIFMHIGVYIPMYMDRNWDRNWDLRVVICLNYGHLFPFCLLPFAS